MAGVSFQKLHDDSYHLFLCVAGGEVAGNFADADGQHRITGWYTGLFGVHNFQQLAMIQRTVLAGRLELLCLRQRG